MPSHSIFESTSHGSLGSKIFILLRDRILNESYKCGDKLNELTLAKELKISRTPIREALKQLELEGLVESIPNKGVYVKGFSPRDIDDMFEIRLSLEGLAVSFAIDRMDEVHLAKIKEVFELLEFYTTKGDFDKVNDFNILFHESIYQATQSTYFEQILKDIHYYVSVTSRHSIARPERLESSLVEHRAILEAIVDGDKDEATERIQRHIRKTQMLVRKYYATRK
ncbi:GntR family transcriptional regulator [uncultured Catenibacterium sp.]|uniref:GntR family transcriptional regulator n=1 Tax=uncultured Catenibacterium sp. TaxID=286142 RepID=UPI0026011389|nr:GntR family transcriptional regulator [uncultured Catenibacterium sp.]